MTGRLDPVDAELPGAARGFFTTRYGGTSAGPWAELNLALHVGDEARHVLANRDLLGEYLGSTWVNFAQQVHGASVLKVEARNAGRRRIVRGGARGVDALVTDQPLTPIGILVADCLPVLIADPVAQVVGAAHAGRGGLAAGVLRNTVGEMTALGAVPDRCVAVIGPGVCGRCYEVPERLRDEVSAQLPGSAATTRGGTPSLDLPAGAEGQLRAAGIGGVRRSEICTMEDDRFYSYRRDGVTGRFAGVVMLTG
jgi:YfiH family protein